MSHASIQKNGKTKMNAKKSIRKSNDFIESKNQLNQEKKTSKSSHRSADYLNVFMAQL